MDWMTAVRLRWTQIGRIVSWGTINWLLDCACFAMMFLALHAPIPWKGLLLAYGAGQLAATLPITPGGLGVVEGSITVALVAFGGAETSTAYAVLLYRIISFWFILVVGWLFIGQMALQVRRGRWTRQAMASEVEAGPVAYEPVAGDGGRFNEPHHSAPARRPRPPRAAVGAAAALLAASTPRRLFVGPHRHRHHRRVLLPRPAHGGEGRGRPRAPRRRAQVLAQRDEEPCAPALRSIGQGRAEGQERLSRRLQRVLHDWLGLQAARSEAGKLAVAVVTIPGNDLSGR